ncbi:helix-turn-helix domain-containing protein [Longimicrobium sp.]|uniref:helix-turn-helix domain-containing protein n=1 Tax=Longimicrobium sp. TaxID=2029185 RepID=UPI003B3B76DC
MSDELPEFFVCSDNIFADFGDPDADELLARAKLMSAVTDIIKERGLTQAQAAKVLGTNQPTVSDLMRGKFNKFSLERLIGFMTALGHDIEIRVRPRPAGSEGPTLSVVGDRM